MPHRSAAQMYRAARKSDALLTGARKLVPDLDTRRVVRAFAGGRPVIQGTNDFFIGQSNVVPGLFQAAGISKKETMTRSVT